MQADSDEGDDQDVEQFRGLRLNVFLREPK